MRTKEQQRVKNATYYLANMEKEKARVMARRREVQTRVNAIKLDRGCADCGYNEKAIALDFDHLPENLKLSSISRMVDHGMTWESIVEEIAKCEVVCAICHRIRTARRSGTEVC